MERKTETIRALAKKKAENRQNEVIAEIKKMAKKKETITFYSVSKKTGAAKSFLYGNETISQLIKHYRDNKDTNQTEESKDVIIQALKKRIDELERDNRRLSQNQADSYKEKYEKLLKENQELRLQLRSAYKY